VKQLKELDLNSKKYIIFDMDGTLIDSIEIWNKVDYLIIKQLSGKEVELYKIQEEKDKYFMENTKGDIYLEYSGYLIDKYKLDITKEELLTLRWSISLELLTNEVKYKKGVVELIKELKEMGYILVLATAGPSNQVDIYSKLNPNTSSKLNLYEYFDLILTKEDVEKKKPDPEIYLKVLEIYNAEAHECLVIEDSLHGILAAKLASMETINIYDKYSDREREDINNLTDYKIDNYEELIEYIHNNKSLVQINTRKKLVKRLIEQLSKIQ